MICTFDEEHKSRVECKVGLESSSEVRPLLALHIWTYRYQRADKNGHIIDEIGTDEDQPQP